MARKKTIHIDPKRGYDQYACFYDKKLDYLNSFEPDKIQNLFGELKDKQVLDAGAGTGRWSIRLAQAGALVTALDISPKILEKLTQKNSQIKTVVGEAEKMPLKDGEFDLVLAAFLVVHLKQLKYFLAETYRVLKPEGKLFLTNINQKKPPELKTKDGYITIESYYHRPDKIKQELEQAGFEIENEIIVKEKDNWINQIIIAKK